jgi:hypothetical protein
MSRIDKLLTRFFSNPKDLTWDEALRVLRHYGFEEVKKGKTSGSRRRFVNDNLDVIDLHEPHPGNILKAYQVNLIAMKLKDYEELL